MKDNIWNKLNDFDKIKYKLSEMRDTIFVLYFMAIGMIVCLFGVAVHSYFFALAGIFIEILTGIVNTRNDNKLDDVFTDVVIERNGNRRRKA